MGYVYILIASMFVSPDVIGTVATIVSLSTLLSTITQLGLSRGVERHLGLSIGAKDYNSLSLYFFSSLTLMVSINVISATMILLLVLTEFTILGLTMNEMIYVAVFLILGGNGWTMICVSLFRSLLKTEFFAIASVISSASKIVVGILLLTLGFEFLAIMMGYIGGAIMMDFILLLYATRYFKNASIKPSLSISHFKDPLVAGLPSWIPNSLKTAAERLGVLSIYGLVSSAAAGLYFVAFSIAFMLYMIPSSVLFLMLPLLSSMKDTRKRTLSRVIRISSSVTIPIALCVMLYPELPLSLMQSEYIEAAQHLRLLALGALAAPLVYGYSNYVYSIGKYVHVLFLGIALNGSQLVLYGILIQFWQEIGIAFAYSLGFFIALSVIIPSALKTGYKVEWLNHLKLIAIPGPVTVIMFLLEPEWYIGIPVIVLVSMISYTRLQLVTKDDILEIAEAFLPQHSVRNLSDRIRPIIKIMYGK